jgi:hypothetical protein
MSLFDGKPPRKPALFDDLAPWRQAQKPAPVTVRPRDKVGPVAPARSRLAPAWQKPGPASATDRSFDAQHWQRMWELKRRVAAGEDLETVKRELWADQYREQD